jgi:hypothetical protein
MDSNNGITSFTEDWCASIIALWWKENVMEVNKMLEYNNDIPPDAGNYILEYDYRTVNQIIESGESPINLLLFSDNMVLETYKNAWKLPNWSVLQDINNTTVIKINNKFYNIFLFIPELLNDMLVKEKKTTHNKVELKKIGDAQSFNQNDYLDTFISLLTDVNKKELIFDAISTIISEIKPIEEENNFRSLNSKDLFQEAASLVVRHQNATISILQRKLGLNYDLAQKIMNRLEYYGIVGPFEGRKGREVRIANEMALEYFLKDLGYKPDNYNEVHIHRNYFSNATDQNILQCNTQIMSLINPVIRDFYNTNKMEIEKRIAIKTQLKKEKNNQQIMEEFLGLEITLENYESVNMRTGENAFIFYLVIDNKTSKSRKINLLRSQYLKQDREQIDMDVFLSGHICGEATLKPNSFKKAGLVFYRTKLPFISDKDILYITIELPQEGGSLSINYQNIDDNWVSIEKSKTDIDLKLPPRQLEKNLLKKIQRFNAFEDQFDVFFEKLSINVNSPSGNVFELLGEMHSRNGTKLKESLSIACVLYDNQGGILEKQEYKISSSYFFAFEVFKFPFYTDDICNKIGSIRIYPKYYNV